MWEPERGLYRLRRIIRTGLCLFLCVFLPLVGLIDELLNFELWTVRACARQRGDYTSPGVRVRVRVLAFAIGFVIHTVNQWDALESREVCTHDLSCLRKYGICFEENYFPKREMLPFKSMISEVEKERCGEDKHQWCSLHYNGTYSQ